MNISATESSTTRAPVPLGTRWTRGRGPGPWFTKYPPGGSTRGSGAPTLPGSPGTRRSSSSANRPTTTRLVASKLGMFHGLHFSVAAGGLIWCLPISPRSTVSMWTRRHRGSPSPPSPWPSPPGDCPLHKMGLIHNLLKMSSDGSLGSRVLGHASFPPVNDRVSSWIFHKVTR